MVYADNMIAPHRTFMTFAAKVGFEPTLLKFCDAAKGRSGMNCRSLHGA
jgi:hypothetical protein